MTPAGHLSRVIALARVRLAVCEALDSLEPDEAAGMLRGLADEIAGEPWTAPKRLPPAPVAPPPPPPAEVAARPADPPRPALVSPVAPRRKPPSDFAHLFKNPAPIKLAILNVLAAQVAPVKQPTLCLALDGVADSNVITTTLCNLRDLGHVRSPSRGLWELAPHLARSG